jgi:hypothetical protein
MPGEPTAVEIRAYQVGFGDCFLLSFVYPANVRRHVLIDFGTMGLPPQRVKKPFKERDYMVRVAKDIQGVCAGKLSAVIATHRHADHISGFSTEGPDGGSGKIIADCKPTVVLQPWTEDPEAAKDALRATKDSTRSRRSFIKGLDAMHHVARRLAGIGTRPPPNMPASVARQLAFLGMDNIKNESAVRNLIAMGKRRGSTAVWAHHGSTSGLARVLPGVAVHVLGPPDLAQTEKIRTMASSDPDEFWMLLGGPKALRGMRVAAPRRRAKAKIPAQARWFQQRLSAMNADQLLEIVRVLDNQMNNTSLILLFEIGNKKLLFPGDAQLENWTWALVDAPDAARTRALLAGVDVYKVGHHGSRNATPKQLLWEKFSKRGGAQGRRLRTLLSTLPGKHGKSAATAVPRKTLLDALKKETNLINTDALPFGANPVVSHPPLVIPV